MSTHIARPKIPADLIRPDIVGFNPDLSLSPMGYIPNPIVVEQTARGERQYDISEIGYKKMYDFNIMEDKQL